jgi:hypothetical protein
MSKGLHIIATCGNRKSQSPLASLGDVPGKTIKVRANRWWRTLSDLRRTEFAALAQAHQLYTGQYWSIVRQLPEEVRKQALRPSLWVVSAGYGLVSGNDRLLPYSATFTPGHVDSVYNRNLGRNHNEDWWSELSQLHLTHSVGPRTLSRLMSDFCSDRFLIIASSQYVSAIQSDLIRGRSSLRKKDNLVLISSRTNSINEKLRRNLVTTDARLLCSPACPENCSLHLLGRGVRGSIGALLARYLVSKMQTWGFSAARFTCEIETALKDMPSPSVTKRTSVTNSEIKKFIKTSMSSNRNASATTLLRSLRDSGKACEQKRFKQLYSEVDKD